MAPTNPTSDATEAHISETSDGSIVDNLIDAPVDCNKSEDILKALIDIRAELKIQSTHLAAIESKYATSEAFELLPRNEDWSDTIFSTFCLSRYPSSERLSKARDLLQSVLQSCYGRLYISLPIATTSQDPSVTAHAALGMPPLAAPAPRGRCILDANTLPFLLRVWPSTLVNEPNSTSDFGVFLSNWLNFQWVLPLAKEQKFQVEMCEMTYNNQGYPKYGRIFRRMTEGSLHERTLENASNPIDGVPWAGKVCGRIIHISLSSTSILSLQAIAFALWQLERFETCNAPTIPVSLQPPNFILCFTSPWDTLPQSFCELKGTSGFLRFQVHWMDISTVCQAEGEAFHGLWLHRDVGDMPNNGTGTGTGKDFHLYERRFAVAMWTTMLYRLPLYTMVVLWEKDRRSQTVIDLDTPLTGNAIPETYRVGYLTGIGVFLSELSRCLKEVLTEWKFSLDKLDQSISMSLSQLTRTKRHVLMFDDTDFSKSDEYFAVLQVLHTCTHWIKQVSADLERTQIALNQMLLTQITYSEKYGAREKEELDELIKAQPLLDSVFARVIAEYESRSQPIINRIERKMEEVKSLRDGLFNATSVREAARGTSLAENSSLQNRYILVFTLATILYLPMGFVTSWYRMNWFSPDSVSSASKVPFIIVFVVVSVATYVVAACGLWFVHDWETYKRNILSCI